MARKWLANVPWDGVVAINEQLCAAKNALHKPTDDGFEPARQMWEETYAQRMEFDEAVEICRRCHKLVPFSFFNGDTFAAIAKSSLESAKKLSANESRILKKVVGHIVAGTSTAEEAEQFKKLLRKLD